MTMCAWIVLLAASCGDDPDRARDADADGVDEGMDCDDGDASIHPGADERCNGVDDDCDAQVDEDAIDAVAIYVDADGDGHGGAAVAKACAPNAGQVLLGDDCDDEDPGAHPGAVEICNGGVDDDCDGESDDDDSPANPPEWYADADHDGYGGGAPYVACEPQAGLLADGSDCDDGSAEIHPGAIEICNGIDDDCDPGTTETGMVAVSGIAYPSIQAAVDAADAGDTVRICDGTYPENIVVSSDVILQGRGADFTILDGRENGSVVHVDRGSVYLTLRGLTLQHGTGTEVDGWYCSHYECGGAVEAYRATSLVVDDCVIQENSAYSGGGIFGPESGFTTISGTVIRNNECTGGVGGGAALFEDGTGTLAISDSEVRDNTCELAAGGGGLLLSAGDYNKRGAASIVDSVIDGNVAGGTGNYSVWGGGGIAVEEIDLTLGTTNISNNTAAESGGGVYCHWFGSVVADDGTVITGNVARDGGGVSSQCPWYGGRIESNDAVSTGGGVYVDGSDAEEFRNVAIASNHSGDAGGGIVFPTGFTLRDSSVTDNTADGGGGGLYAWDPGNGTATTDNCVVTGNVATGDGGGAYVATHFESIATDWGEGKLDNAPDDVYFDFSDDDDPVVYTGFAGGADFVCSRGDGVCE